MPIQIPKSKAGIGSLIVGIGLLIVAIGHAIVGDYRQAALDFTGAAGTLGLPSLMGSGPSPVTIRTPGPVVVEATPSATRPTVEVRTRDEH